jgi:hypothetical protein
MRHRGFCRRRDSPGGMLGSTHPQVTAVAALSPLQQPAVGIGFRIPFRSCRAWAVEPDRIHHVEGDCVDPNVLALAGTAGTTVVALLATDAWEQTRRGVTTLWRRFRPEAAEEIDGLLSRSRATLLDGGEPVGVESEWQLRLGALLAQHPDAAAELDSLLRELAEPSGQTISGGVHLKAHAEGSGQVYQSVRDQTVNNYR